MVILKVPIVVAPHDPQHTRNSTLAWDQNRPNQQYLDVREHTS
jgi:hypothetical protein